MSASSRPGSVPAQVVRVLSIAASAALIGCGSSEEMNSSVSSVGQTDGGEAQQTIQGAVAEITRLAAHPEEYCEHLGSDLLKQYGAPPTQAIANCEATYLVKPFRPTIVGSRELADGRILVEVKRGRDRKSVV